MRAIEGDMCEVEQRTHVGVPLIGETQWVIPPKATPLVGGAPKSAPASPRQELIQVLSLPEEPWHLREQTPSREESSPISTLELVDREEGSSMSSGLDVVDPKPRPVFHPTKVGGPPPPEVGEENATGSVAGRHLGLRPRA